MIRGVSMDVYVAVMNWKSLLSDGNVGCVGCCKNMWPAFTMLVKATSQETPSGRWSWQVWGAGIWQAIGLNTLICCKVRWGKLWIGKRLRIHPRARLTCDRVPINKKKNR